MIETWSLSGDLATHWVAIALTMAAVALVLLLLELRTTGRGWRRMWVALSGVAALSALLLAVLRPVRVEERGATVGARVLWLLDGSRSIDLPGDGSGTRRDAMSALLPKLEAHFEGVRARALVFGRGEPTAVATPPGEPFAVRPQLSSDLSAALAALAAGTDELPQAIVVVSDGRLDRPADAQTDAQLEQALGALEIPMHTVSLARKEPADASIVGVRMAGAVVAHQAVALTVEVACTGGLSCDEIPVVARELHLESKPVERAKGVVHTEGGRGTIDLELILDRAGKRIVEVAIETPEDDTIADNDRRLLTVAVARDRVRLLHVAGRPTYDVRALRTWLKSDASVDVVAFFILRTHTDNVQASPDELALIPFPVDELFTKHLPSFDAVVLQDFDAAPYGLKKHLAGLSRYVRRGGGLIMVGGPNAFVLGNYAQTKLASVLPVELQGIPRETAVDFASFAPRVTRAGLHAPVLEPLQALLSGSLPEMPGTNVVGDAREDATVLLEHPSLTTKSGSPMPVLALGEYGSGRSIALTVDGSHKLLFSRFALGTAGRAHGAFWDALLGWLMRDPRFEPAKVKLPDGCIAGVETSIELRAPFVEADTKANVTVQRMGDASEVHSSEVKLSEQGEPVRLDIGKLAAGGYTATVRLERQGRSAPSRYDFACEVGGEEWADPRPDVARLAAIAKATEGVAVSADDISALPLPKASQVVAERRVRTLLPAWAWSLFAALLLGAHWIVRRRAGLS